VGLLNVTVAGNAVGNVNGSGAQILKHPQGAGYKDLLTELAYEPKPPTFTCLIVSGTKNVFLMSRN
jgi:hypothetical protein